MSTPDTPQYLAPADIGAMLSMKPEYVTDKLSKRPDFPRPDLMLSGRIRRWKRETIERWIERQEQMARR